jgi:hypothetical protein
MGRAGSFCSSSGRWGGRAAAQRCKTGNSFKSLAESSVPSKARRSSRAHRPRSPRRTRPRRRRAAVQGRRSPASQQTGWLYFPGRPRPGLGTDDPDGAGPAPDVEDHRPPEQLSVLGGVADQGQADAPRPHRRRRATEMTISPGPRRRAFREDQLGRSGAIPAHRRDDPPELAGADLTLAARGVIRQRGRGWATSSHLSLPLSLPGLSLPRPPGLSRPPSLSLSALPCPFPGRSADSADCSPEDSLPWVRLPEPAAREAGGWPLDDLAASAASRARPGSARAVLG